MLNWLLGEKWYVNIREDGGGILYRFEGRGNGFLRYAASVGEQLSVVMPSSDDVPFLCMMDVLAVERRITTKGVSFHITVKVVRE